MLLLHLVQASNLGARVFLLRALSRHLWRRWGRCSRHCWPGLRWAEEATEVWQSSCELPGRAAA